MRRNEVERPIRCIATGPTRPTAAGSRGAVKKLEEGLVTASSPHVRELGCNERSPPRATRTAVH
jgi:hypothetical protein